MNEQDIVDSINDIYKNSLPNEVRSRIEKYFIPSNEEKRNNAEIPTPVILVNEMLNIIPVGYWKTPKTYFEPCCGKGNFVLGIFDKLYEGLEESIPNKTERIRIIMKSIYYSDITPMNVFITTELLKCHIQYYTGNNEMDYSFNSYVGDTLQINLEEQFNIKGFDAVIGNPPYNGSGSVGIGNSIWQKFTTNALNYWIVKNGLLLFVHPSGWRKPDSKRGKYLNMFDLMTNENQMVYLEIHGLKDGLKTFKCGTRYDWYLIEKTRKYKESVVIDEENKKNKLDLSNFKWLPNSNIQKIKSILANDDDIRCNIIYSTPYHSVLKKQMSRTQNEEFKYECIHTTPKAGPRIMYSNVNNKGHFGISKVIFGDSGISNPIIDMDGNYGMTEHSMAIQVSTYDEANNISNAIKSDNFMNIIKSCSFSTYQLDWRIFKEFKNNFWKEFVLIPRELSPKIVMIKIKRNRKLNMFSDISSTIAPEVIANISM
jgi:hypothetical protein